MISRMQLENEWTAWEKEVKDLEPHAPERRRLLQRIAEIWADLSHISQRLHDEPSVANPAQRYFGLDALKISALNIAQNIEADEINILSLYFQYTHDIILANILRRRLMPDSGKRIHTPFSAGELGELAKARLQLEQREQVLWERRAILQKEIAELREAYGLFLFEESSFEAARSFSATAKDAQALKASWLAFSQLLTTMALQIHDEERAKLLKKSRRIEAQRESLFESCAALLAKKANGKDAKRRQRQFRQNLAEIKKLESEIESTLSELSIPGLGDSASLLVKKNAEQATTFQPVKISQSTGDKT